ncbi:spirocyclase AveC family protein [Streptomyces massasporeus]|uniref:spirocyclase AveC family protein n=1 Tax=Streptomyces massasporeus TaxID=67324 RepID=UPI00368A4072
MTSSRAATAAPEATHRRRWAVPIIAWAGVGAVALLLQAWFLGRWVLDGGLRAGADTGYTISPVRAAIAWGFQAFLAVTLVAVTVKLLRDCRRAHAVTLMAALFVGWVLCFWQSPLVNYRQLTFAPSRYAPNVSSWGPYLPGWDPPQRELLVESLMNPGILCYGLMILWPWLQQIITSRLAGKRPYWGLARLMGASVLAAVVLDILLESAWISTGLYTFPTSLHALSLFGGHWYQLPLPVALNVALTVSSPIVFMQQYAKRHGTTVHIFRGSEHYGPRAQGWLRILAGIGMTNVQMTAYVIVNLLFGYLGTDPIPADTPSYLWPL